MNDPPVRPDTSDRRCWTSPIPPETQEPVIQEQPGVSRVRALADFSAAAAGSALYVPRRTSPVDRRNSQPEAGVGSLSHNPVSGLTTNPGVSAL